MADLMALENVLEDLKQAGGISDAVLVSRSGMHIAGKVPQGVHTETFVAMSAIMMGAAETSTSELKDKLELVTVKLAKSKLIVSAVTPKAVLVLRAEPRVSEETALSLIEDAIPRIEKAL